MQKFSKPFQQGDLINILGEPVTEEFSKIWIEFVNMRNSLAKTRILEDSTQERILKRLAKQFDDPDKRLFSLMQTTECKWMGFYEPQRGYLLELQERRKEKNKHKKQEIEQIQESAPKQKMIEVVRKQAASGSEVAKQLLYRLEHPEIKKEEDRKEKAERDFETMKKCEQELSNRTFKKHIGGYSSI